MQLDEQPTKRRGVCDAELPTVNGRFDCNICLDFTVEPVVTLCGHLYCWPCIFKWLQIKDSASRRCPVCKASLSLDALVPIYGRGGHNGNADRSLEIPRRPASVHHAEEQEYQQGRYQRHSYFSNGGCRSPVRPMGTQVFQSTSDGAVEGLAAAMFPWMCRNDVSVFYSRPHFATAGMRNPRLRRKEMQAERLLHQLWSFLFCFAMLCLVSF